MHTTVKILWHVVVVPQLVLHSLKALAEYCYYESISTNKLSTFLCHHYNIMICRHCNDAIQNLHV